ncbi:heme/hemin ABC transporter substrate-binding protein [Chitinimonas lacunae]|uniref:Hemin ABC transporter substrate-binding protein n=1 Tax=Chitinimonas lacunae TaxID=1963018 RepID=A0ABV8MHZ9_9NEIS
MRRWLSPLLALSLFVPAGAAERVVALTADVAEIAVALGRASDVIGRDQMARQPELSHAKVIGLSRALSVEPVARLQPTLVLGSAAAQPSSIWEQFRRVGIRAVQVSAHGDGRDYAEAIRTVGSLLGATPAADRLAQQWQQGMTPAAASGRRILISYEGRTVAGRDTPSDLLIRAAGAINVAAEVEGHKPLEPEAIARLAPDLILVAGHNRAVYGSLEQLRVRPDIAATPAGRRGRVYEWPVHELFNINLNSPAVVKRLRELGAS